MQEFTFQSQSSASSNSKEHALAYNSFSQHLVSNSGAQGIGLSPGIKAKTQLCPWELIFYGGKQIIKTQEKK